jgi:hypothetical protein
MRGTVRTRAVARDLPSIVDAGGSIERLSGAAWEHSVQVNHAGACAVQEGMHGAARHDDIPRYLAGGIDALAETGATTGKGSEIDHAGAGAVQECMIRAARYDGIPRHLAGGIDAVTLTVGTAESSEIDHAGAGAVQERMSGRKVAACVGPSCYLAGGINALTDTGVTAREGSEIDHTGAGAVQERWSGDMDATFDPASGIAGRSGGGDFQRIYLRSWRVTAGRHGFLERLFRSSQLRRHAGCLDDIDECLSGGNFLCDSVWLRRQTVRP